MAGVDDYRDYLHGLGLADRTVGLYVRHVARAAVWLGGVEGVVGASATQLARYTPRVPGSSSSRQHLRNALRHLWTMHERRDAPTEAIRVPPAPRGFCRAVSEDDATALVKTAMGWTPDGTAVLLGMYLALRASEIAAARWDRFSEDRDWYTVTGKGDVTATLPVHVVLRAEVRLLGSASPWLFPGARGRAHVTPQTVWLWTKRVAKAAGVSESLTVHQLRHTALATVNDRTGDLRATQEFARHASPETTRRYTRVTAQRLRAVVDALDYV